jgi:2-polyprenyl-3-methyl-5-hydroxy-6-metoxy-1,4-benzoquinol methylase
MPVQQLDDPVYGSEQHATEHGPSVRRAFHAGITGPNARDVALEAILEQQPTAMLEVGCGAGELAEPIAAAPGINVVAVDLASDGRGDRALPV